MALPEIGMSVDVDVLDEIFERETPKCKAKHSWSNNPPSACTHEVAYMVHTCIKTIPVCEHTFEAWLELVANHVGCAEHPGLQADHRMVPV